MPQESPPLSPAGGDPSPTANTNQVAPTPGSTPTPGAPAPAPAAAPAAADPASLRILCFGDSLTSGFTASGRAAHPYALYLEAVLAEAFPGTDIHIDTDGLPGDRACIPGSYFDRIALHDEPYDWTVVLGGTNDLGALASARDVYDALLAVWDTVLDRNDQSRVLALTVPEAPGLDVLGGRISHQREVLNSMIERHRHERFHVFDLYAALPFRALPQAERTLYWDDALHLTPEGYDRMGELVGACLVNLIKAQAQAHARAASGSGMGLMTITRYRPAFHLTPPRGWLNDPCAPFQDRDDLWHIYFQWVPNHTDWNAEIGWGHATSPDFLTWRADKQPTLMPGEPYDCMGVFTGNALPGAGSSEKVSVVYSAINAAARTPGYTQGQEQLALAESVNGGKTFVKAVDNPLDVQLPNQLTGFRDPFFAPWPAMAKTLGHAPEQIYALVSGGILDRGPTVFLYTVSPDGKDWGYLGPLVEPAAPRPESWVGDRGWNWECGGFFSLPPPERDTSMGTTGSEIEERQYLVVGSEGQWSDPFSFSSEGGKRARPPHWQLWFSGPLTHTTGNGAQLDIASTDGDGASASGILDWGCLYAAQTMQDQRGRRVMWGWIPDDDLTSAGRAAQGWAGSISLPRELYRLVLRGITGALSPLQPHKGVFALPGTGSGGRGQTVETLGIRPLEELACARKRKVDTERGERVTSFECSLSVAFDPLSTESIGLSLDFAEGGLAQIVFRPDDDRIVVFRPPAPQRLEDDEIDTRPIHGRFTLFRTEEARDWEPLRLRAYHDPPILEVFANDRFALTTHIYASSQSGCAVGVTCTPAGSATTAKLDVWDFGPPEV